MIKEGIVVILGFAGLFVLIFGVIPLCFKFFTQFIWVRLWNLNPDTDWIIVQDEIGNYYVCDSSLKEKPQWVRYTCYHNRDDQAKLRRLRFDTVYTDNAYKHESVKSAKTVIRKLCSDFPQTAAILDIGEIKASL